MYALCGLATAEAASIDVDYNVPMPVLLNRMLAFHIDQIPEISIQHVTSICFKLARLFGTLPGTIFELHSPTNRLPERPGLIYQRLCTHSINMPGLTLLWAIHYEHARVEELIKMVHRLRTPSSYYMFCGLQAVGLIVALYFVLKRASDPSLVVAALITLVLAVNALVLYIYASCYTRLHLSETGEQVGRNGKWRIAHTWSLYTALGHRAT